ncbi:MAG: M43 family zinc metalloprotease, partial [Flavobacterium sp.]
MNQRILLLFLIVFQIVYSQTRTCGMEQQMQELRFNPLLKNKYKEHLRLQELADKQVLNRIAQAPQATFYIPVAVHFPTGSNANRACLVELAQNQIAILNNDFRGTNSDLSLWNNVSQYFPGVNTGSFDVQFVLATQNHPAGTDSNLVNGQPCVTIGYNFGQGSDWDSNFVGYLNFVVKNLSGGVLGYAYLASSPSNGAAVFIDNNAFGSTSSCTGFVPQSPFNKGRTLTHELGHYLNLEHIWGDADCGNDFVSDTPLHYTANGGCPST